ncbi:MAG: trypsin-like peptidase domain-containing protein [Alphaproteobacteria bacterium]|nr:trypsin-like peptidase domain-containing protein [Alphaproteobacteria bacterium]
MDKRWGFIVALIVGAVAGAGLQRALAPVAPPALQTPDPADVFAQVHASVLDIQVTSPESRVGAGVAISETEIVTARHLVFDTVDPIEVVDSHGNVQIATVVGTDARTDLALLAVEGPLVPAELGDSSAVRVGDRVVAVGNPFGLRHSLSVGVIGGMHRKLDRGGGPRVDFMQLSIPLNPGNSGGPIFAMDSRVVGLLTGTHTQGQAIAFAVPAERLIESLPALRSGRQVTRAFLGVRVEADGAAVRVVSVVPSGPADRAGVRPGDALTAFDDQVLATPEDLYARLDSMPGGARTTIRLLRDGQLHIADVELADWAEQPTVIAGMTLRPVPGSGGEVVAVRPRSRAARAGVLVDDIVKTVNGLPMQAPSDVKDTVTAETAQLEIVRDGAPMTVQL